MRNLLYLKRYFNLLPLKGKVAFHANWNEKSFSESDFENATGVGLVLNNTNIVVIDIDKETSQSAPLLQWFKENKYPILKTAKGYHIYTQNINNQRKSIKDLYDKERFIKILDGVDILAGGYVVLQNNDEPEPRRFINGYDFDCLLNLPKTPSFIYAILDLNKYFPKSLHLSSILERFERNNVYLDIPIRCGSRNDTLLKLLVSSSNYIDLFSKGNDLAIIFNNLCEEQLNQNELKTVISSAYKYANKNIQNAQDKSTELSTKELKKHKSYDILYNMLVELIQNSNLVTYHKSFNPENDRIYAIISNNIVSNPLSKQEVFDYVRDLIKDNLTEVYNNNYLMNKLMKEFFNNLSNCPTLNREYHISEYITNNKSILLFKNCYVEVEKDTINIVSWKRSKYFVFKHELIDLDFDVITDQNKLNASVLNRYLDALDTTGRTNTYLKLLFGMLASGCDDATTRRAVILTDSDVNENVNGGGTGKSLFGKMLSKVRSTLNIGGYDAYEKDKYVFESYKIGDKIIFMDDVPNTFQIEKYKTEITEYIKVKAKYQAEVEVPSSNYRILITANYLPNIISNAHERRVFLYKTNNSMFNKYTTPLKYFKHVLINDWDKDEWLLFYNTTIKYIQLYLNNKQALLEYAEQELESVNDERIQNLLNGNDYYFDTIERNMWHNKDILFEQATSMKYHFSSKKQFTKQLAIYCKLRNITLNNNRKTNSVMLQDNNTPNNDETNNNDTSPDKPTIIEPQTVVNEPIINETTNTVNTLNDNIRIFTKRNGSIIELNDYDNDYVETVGIDDLNDVLDIKDIENNDIKFGIDDLNNIHKPLIVSFDLECQGLDANNNKILAIAVCERNDTEVKTHVIKHDNEVDILKDFNDYLKAVSLLNNEVILTGYNISEFDIPFLMKRCEVNGIKSCFNSIRKDNKPLLMKVSQTEGTIKSEALTFELNLCTYGNIAIVDAMHLVCKDDFVKRMLPAYNLKDVAKSYKVNVKDRPIIAGSEIEYVMTTDYETFTQYITADVIEAAALTDKLIMPYIVIATIAKVSLMDAVVKSTAWVWNKLLETLTNDRPLADDKVQYKGAIVLSNNGLFNNCAKIDVASLYPNIMLSYGIHSRKDTNKLALKYLKTFTLLRLELKKQAKEGNANAKIIEAGLKIMINSLYGFYGTGGYGFNDMGAAEKVTEYGRKLLTKIIYAIETNGGVIVEADTDGVIFQINDSNKTANDILDAAQAALPKNFKLELEYDNTVTFVQGKKNYIITDKQGNVITVKGSKFKARNRNKIYTEIIPNVINMMANESFDAVVKYCDKIVDEINKGAAFDLLCVYKKVAVNDKRIMDYGYKKGDRVCFCYLNEKSKDLSFSSETGYDIKYYRTDFVETMNEVFRTAYNKDYVSQDMLFLF